MIRTCRVCGCTAADCSQCIKKTGSPCHWIEQDLCSACVDDPRAHQSTLNLNNEMQFFEQLNETLKGAKKITIVASKTGEQISVMVLPEFASEGVQEKTRPLMLAGTAAELDEGFFNEVRKPVEAVMAAGLRSNADEVAKEVGEAAQEEAEEKSKPAGKKKSNQPKKPVAKKPGPAKKSAPAKKAAPTPKATAKKPAGKVVPASGKKPPETKKPGPKPKVKAEPTQTPDPHHEADLKNALIPDQVENETNVPNPDTNVPDPETNVPDPETNDQEIETPVVDQPKDPETNIVAKTETLADPIPDPEPKISADEEKFKMYMSDGDDAFKLKDYTLAQTTYQNALVLSLNSGSLSAKHQELARTWEKKAGQWVRAMAKFGQKTI